MKKISYLFLTLSLGVLLSACSEPETPQAQAKVAAQGAAPQPPIASAQNSVNRGHDFTAVMRGARLYQQNCASCHGQQAQGQSGWRQKGINGQYPPPPLNGTGHAWHHPMATLKETIKQGTVKRGGSMPAWGGKLSDQEIERIIAWLQSRWPDDVYAAWRQTEEKARAGKPMH